MEVKRTLSASITDQISYWVRLSVANDPSGEDVN